MNFCLCSLYYILLRDCSLQIILMDGVKIPKDHQFATFKVTSITSLQSSLFLILKLTLNFVSTVSLSWCHVMSVQSRSLIFYITKWPAGADCTFLLHIAVCYICTKLLALNVHLRLKHCLVFLPSCLLQGSKASESQELRTSVLKLWRVVCRGNGMWLHLVPGRWKY